MFLVATLSLCLLLPLVQSQAVGRVNEDVWVEGKLGSKVKVFDVFLLCTLFVFYLFVWLEGKLGSEVKVFFVLAIFGFLCLCALIVSVCGWRANWEAR